jgi:thiol:disulfide interchange protein DsbD
MALLLWAFGPHVTRMEDVTTAPASATATMATSTQGWQPWAPGAPDALVASGRPVFVDFTAAWCVTCQYNKKTTLANAEVLADLQAKNVAGAAGAQWSAGVCVLPARQAPGGIDRSAER